MRVVGTAAWRRPSWCMDQLRESCQSDQRSNRSALMGYLLVAIPTLRSIAVLKSLYTNAFAVGGPSK